jgi:Cu+-exporting ATPase
MVGTGIGARRGILIKNGEALERGRKIDVVVLDKTGTLTEGRPAVIAIFPTKAGIGNDDVLRVAASLEQISEHPLGQSIVREAKDRGVPLAAVHDFANVPGKGIRGRLEDSAVVVGNLRLMTEAGVPLEAALRQIESCEARSQTAIVVAAMAK